VSYIVQAGDTLGILAQRTASTVSQIAAANCLTNPNLLAAGQVIRLARQPVLPTTTLPPQQPPVIRWGGTPPNMLCIVVPAVANAPIYSDAGLISFRAFLGDWAPWLENIAWGGSANGAFRIQLPDGTSAYMAAATVQMRGNCGIVPLTLPPPWTSTPTPLPFPDTAAAEGGL
jgi:LysM repeat protein